MVAVTHEEKQKIESGAARVSTGPATQSRNRNIAAAGTTYSRSTNGASWLPGSHISSIRINPIVPNSGAPTIGTILGYAVIGASSELLAATFLADPGSISTDVQYKPIIMGLPCDFDTVLGTDFSGEILFVDILPIVNQMRFVVEAN